MLENIICSYLTYKEARLQELEPYAARRNDDLLDEVSSIQGVKECVVLKTCNRVEAYVYSNDVKMCERELSSYFDNPSTRFLSGEMTLRHLLRVACGLDSIVLGENQIQKQVKEAYESALRKKKCGKALSLAFRRALSAGKRVRSFTGIDKGPVSIGSVAVDLAGDYLGGLDGKNILVIGAGSTATLVARSLAKRNSEVVFVANRTYENARNIALELNGRAIRFERISDFLPRSDVIIVATSAPHLILTKERVERAGVREALIIDLGSPRNVDPEIGELPKVKLIDLDDLSALRAENLGDRMEEAGHAEKILEEELGKTLSLLKAMEVDSVIKSITEKCELIKEHQFSKALSMMGPLEPAQLEVIEDFATSLTSKLLADPIDGLKRSAANGERELADSAIALFKLDGED